MNITLQPKAITVIYISFYLKVSKERSSPKTVIESKPKEQKKSNTSKFNISIEHYYLIYVGHKCI